MWYEILSYFETLEKRPVERMAFLVGGLLIFWIIEGAIPLIQPKYKKNKLRHAVVNFGFTVIHLIIHTFLAIIIVILSDWCKKESFGLVYWMNAGALGTVLVSLFVLDFFGGWLVHSVPGRPFFIFHSFLALCLLCVHSATKVGYADWCGEIGLSTLGNSKVKIQKSKSLGAVRLLTVW